MFRTIQGDGQEHGQLAEKKQDTRKGRCKGYGEALKVSVGTSSSQAEVWFRRWEVEHG